MSARVALPDRSGVHIDVSVPNRQPRSDAVAPGSAGRIKAGGRRVYRLVSPLIIWWTWVGVVLLGLGDLVVQGHDWISLKFGFGLLTATGAIYAATLWPKVIADDDGIIVDNPFRRFRIPWAAVSGIFLADSVEVVCARPAPKTDKTVYSWALASPRRARARAQLRGQQWDRGKRNRPAEYDRLPDAARNVVKLTPAEIMARELGQLSEDARSRSTDPGTTERKVIGAGADPVVAGSGPDGSAASAPGGSSPGRSAPGGSSGADSHRPARSAGTGAVMSSRWAWRPLAATVVPAIAFAIAQLVR